MRKLLLCLIGIAPSVATATSCDDLAKYFDLQDKAIAMVDARGFFDNSAPREMARQVEVSNSLAKKQIALSMMTAQKCPMPKSVERMYLGSAIECRRNTECTVNDLTAETGEKVPPWAK